MDFLVGIGSNIRKSPYFEATVADGVSCFSVYNHMYIPAHFGDPAAEYKRLTEGVAMWDVAAQRQVEIVGPDAMALMQYLTARDVSTTKIGQGRYVPLCDYEGNLINDPVLLMLSDSRYWISIADSDMELWVKAVAHERGYDVEVFEPDVSPMAVQGPKAEDLVAELFGEWVRDVKYFWFRETELQGIPLVLARSGWSKQGGFELYLTDESRGGELWNIVKNAGSKYGIGPGAPNDVERVESGLLSYGSDARHISFPANPFELGLGKLVDLESGKDFIGRDALARIKAEGARRRYTGFVISGNPITGSENQHPLLRGETEVGIITEMVFSPRLNRNIGIGLVDGDITADADGLTVVLNGATRKVALVSTAEQNPTTVRSKSLPARA
ncbi:MULTISPECIES: glycine cleavage T C-terminal barrel domain-containing protein [unclassified Leisingera]|uniref:glycine cleavage T C-terminal barrel domain-containing protein n=1 Tax=unclassified Leisingera TaxID=2614906 RepID=UPI0008037A20|nr:MULTISPECIES: glycine cleavage T C-terminal barrel domain-containing protein [unclassified Leisingera]NSY41608.1 glycine cleavage system protein T [Leisingera sp. ANG59]OBY26156.1 glycine cleavage system protein T [Leisingera sp. JC1]